MMKTYNNSFSFRRVGLLVKRDVGENWKTCLFLTLALSLVFLCIMYSCSWLPFEVKGGYEAFSLAVLRGCKSVFAYYSIFVFSGVMANIQAQGDRTNFLMLPASNLEKFSARLLYVVFLAFVPFVVGFLLADVLHMLTFPLFVGNGETVRTFLLPGLWDVKSELKSAGQEFLDLVHLNIDLSSFVCALVIFSLVESLRDFRYLPVPCIFLHPWRMLLAQASFREDFYFADACQDCSDSCIGN